MRWAHPLFFVAHTGQLKGFGDYPIKGNLTDSKDNVSKKFLPCLLTAMPPTTVIAVSSAVFKVDGDVIS